MKFSNLFATFFAAAFFVNGAFAATFTVDPVHSNVDFTIRHLTSNVRGSFGKFEGTFDFDDAKGDGLANVKFSIDAASINTANKKRDDHLRSPDFFDAKKNPKLTFVSKSATKSGDKKFKVEGDLTIRGVTKPATFDVEYLGTGPNMAGGESAGFTATTKLNRKDFGINWNKTLDAGGVVLGDEVTIHLNVEAAKAPPAKAAEQKKAQVKEEMKPSDEKKK